MPDTPKHTDEEAVKILSDFAQKLAASQEELEPDIAEIIRKNFFKMLTKDEDLKKVKE